MADGMETDVRTEKTSSPAAPRAAWWRKLLDALFQRDAERRLLALGEPRVREARELPSLARIRAARIAMGAVAVVAVVAVGLQLRRAAEPPRNLAQGKKWAALPRARTRILADDGKVILSPAVAGAEGELWMSLDLGQAARVDAIRVSRFEAGAGSDGCRPVAAELSLDGTAFQRFEFRASGASAWEAPAGGAKARYARVGAKLVCAEMLVSSQVVGRP